MRVIMLVTFRLLQFDCEYTFLKNGDVSLEMNN